MVDNVAFTPGSGATGGTDDVGGIHYPRVKVVWGADGTVTDTSAAAPLPVVQTGTHNIGTVTTVTTVSAVTAISNALPAGTNNIGDVDVLTVNGVAPAFGSGANGATVQRVALATDSPGVTALGQAAMAASLPVAIASNQTSLGVTPAAGELHIGEVGGNTVVKTITMTADTAIMASADIIADTQQLDAAFRKADGTGVLQSLTVFDPDDNAAFAFDVYIHNTTTSMGSENAAISITDANAAAGILGVVSFATTDAKDLINGRMYHKSNLGIPVSAVSGTDDLYFSIVNGSGTPTFAGGSIPMRVGILRD